MTKLTCEQVASISIWELKRVTLHASGSHFKFSWDSSSGGGSQDIALKTTDCFFGGFRYWFQCPGCARRAAILYLPFGAKVFACRNCYKLTYRSCQNHKTFGEGFSRLVKLTERLEKILNEKGRRGKRKQARRLIEKIEGNNFYSMRNRGGKGNGL